MQLWGLVIVIANFAFSSFKRNAAKMVVPDCGKKESGLKLTAQNSEKIDPKVTLQHFIEYWIVAEISAMRFKCVSNNDARIIKYANKLSDFQLMLLTSMIMMRNCSVFSIIGKGCKKVLSIKYWCFVLQFLFAYVSWRENPIKIRRESAKRGDTKMSKTNQLFSIEKWAWKGKY